MFEPPESCPEENVSPETDDEDRCLEIVRRVVDEETALEMVAAFLLITQDHRVPPTASIHFHSCYFDHTSGGIFWKNIYRIGKSQTPQVFLS